jgi:glycosyltransferase involved in cell wall biosynthesis
MSGPLNILFVESGTTGGGSFESLYQLLRTVDRSRVNPFVCFLNHTRYMELVSKLGVPVFLLTDFVYSQNVPAAIRRKLERKVDKVFEKTPALASLMITLGHGYLISRLSSIVQREKIDLIYCNDQINRDIFGCHVARRTGVPMISHLRSLDGKTFTGAKAEFANRWVDAYIANSNYVADYWTGQGAAKEKMHTVFNAVEDTEVQPVDIREELGLPVEKRVIVSMGRLVAFKGHEFLLKSFAKLGLQREDVHLLLVGDGPEKNRLLNLIISLGVEDQVNLLRYDSRGPSLIGGADLFVLSSNYEPFGRVVIEAMNVGVPVIATGHGGVLDIIENEKNGLLVEYGDREGLANAMERMLTDDSLRKSCVLSGYETVATKFDLQARTRDIENIIENVVGAARPIRESA